MDGAFAPNQYVSLVDAEPGSTVAPCPGPHRRRRRGRAHSHPDRYRRLHPVQSETAAPQPPHHVPHAARRHARSCRRRQLRAGPVAGLPRRLGAAGHRCSRTTSIREVALDGPDTSARTKLVWQVAVLPLRDSAGLTPDQLRERLQPVNRGRLGGPGAAPAHIAARRTISIASRSTTAAPAARRRSNGRATTARSSGPSPAATATRSSWSRSSLTIAAAWRKATGWKSRTTTRCWRIAPFPCCVSAPSIPATAASCCPATSRPTSAATLPGIRCCGAGTTRRRCPAAASGQEGWLELEDGVEIQFVDPHEFGLPHG